MSRDAGAFAGELRDDARNLRSMADSLDRRAAGLDPATIQVAAVRSSRARCEKESERCVQARAAERHPFRAAR